MREQSRYLQEAPDFAALHPGYDLPLFTCCCAKPAVLA